MKKLSIFTLIFFTLIAFSKTIQAQEPFYAAIKNCNSYKQDGSVEKNGINNIIQISLNKNSAGKCVYKEKIIKKGEYYLMTCNFESHQLDYISKTQENFVKQYESEIQKNQIYDAKLTTNVEIFNEILANPAYCKITTSDKKLSL